MMNLVLQFVLLSFIFNVVAIAANGKDWWKCTTIYLIYVRSFKDSNGDGIGDLPGIKSKLDHFVDLGIETIWITPFFASPMHDFGYDIENHTAVDPMFGTMEDFEELVEEMNKRGLKLIIDLVINHSSDQHPWFEKSVNRIEPYTDFYIWADAKGFDQNGVPIPPNNWLSIFGGSGWKWNPKRKQFYFHHFSAKQPDFNLRNLVLKAELKGVLKFWLDKGAAGARLDAPKFFMEDQKLRDEPLRDKNSTKTVLAYTDLVHIYTLDLWENYEFIHELREFVDNNYNSSNNEKIIIAEAYTDLNHTMMYYGTQDYKIAHYSFNYDLMFWNTTLITPKILDQRIQKWMSNMPKNGVANWQSENHDLPRFGKRFSVELMDVMLITVLTLPGMACIYYGQEIGMMEFYVRPDQTQDRLVFQALKQTRDSCRLPMQWDDSPNAGFTSKSVSWLPVNPDYWRVNVKAQKREPNSRYNMYKALSKLRKTKSLKYGNLQSYLISTWVYAFTRSLLDEATVIVIMNLGTETEIFHLHNSIPKLPSFVKVVTASLNAGYKQGTRIRTDPSFPQFFALRPLSAVVLTTKS